MLPYLTGSDWTGPPTLGCHPTAVEAGWTLFADGMSETVASDMCDFCHLTTVKP